MGSIEETHRKIYAECQNEKQAGAKTMLWLSKVDKKTFDQLNDLAEQTIFTRRHYGQGVFYSWAHHEKLPKIMDAWPASRWPKGVLCLEFAKALNLY